MTRRFAVAWLFALLLCAGSTFAQAVDPAPLEFRDAVEARRFHALAEELRCVKCQNQSLADSNAAIAHDLRREVLTLMQEGRSDAEIKDFLVDRYGEFVLYRPRVQESTWLLWFGPLLLLAGGAVLIARIVRQRTRGAATRSKPGNAGDEQEW